MIIIARKTGQLGNRLFLFAHVIAHAIEHRMRACNPSFDEYSQYFISTSRDVYSRFPPKASALVGTAKNRTYLYNAVIHGSCWGLTHCRSSRFHQIIEMDWEDGCDLGNPSIQQLVASRWLFITWGFRFRNYDAFQKNAEKIRHYFRPITVIEDNVNRLVAKLRVGSSVLIGIHIRRGDYKQHLEGRYFYEVADYLALMKQVEGLFPSKRVIFLICSNEPQDPATFTDFEFGFGSNHLVEDMYAFAQCDYLIGPPSTYTQWASFYGQVPRFAIKSRDVQIDLGAFEVCLNGECDDDADLQNRWIQSDGKSVLDACSLI